MKRITKYAVLIIFLAAVVGCQSKNIPPTGNIINPLNESKYEIGDIITISVDADDVDGFINEVKFYINDIGVSSSSDFPYNYQWTTAEKEEGTYKIKASITDDQGVTVEDEISIMLYTVAGTFTDSRDDTEYDWVRIGDQVWMAENLAYLPSVSPSSEGSGTKPYYYVYGYQGSDVDEAKATTNYQTSGVLYNWPAAMNSKASSTANPSGVKGICPTGWHLPSDAEWVELKLFLINNGYNYDGTTSENKIAKALASTTGWNGSDSIGAVGHPDFLDKQNVTGFSALPGGERQGNGHFFNVGIFGFWWSAAEYNSNNALPLVMYYNTHNVYLGLHYKELGFSVRCVKD